MVREQVMAVLKCGRCKIDAKGIDVDGEVTRIYCPTCGVEVLGVAAVAEMRSDLNHRFAQEEGREFVNRELTKRLKLRKPLRHSSTQSSNPWPFVLKADN